MSAPRVRRTVARMPLSSSVFANFCTACLPVAENSVSATGLTGMRLTCMGKLSLFEGRRALLRSLASRSAAATESFLPEISVY